MPLKEEKCRFSFWVSIILANFAAVNTKTKRPLASWILLAVFVPMVLLSSLHIHTAAESAAAECAECVDHQCHGHLTALASPVHACVLCQFLSLPMVVATAAVAVLLINHVGQRLFARSEAELLLTPAGAVVTRGPPAV